jgi:prepilin-type N-terminal cleavage/methylation domain-containing protein
MKSVNTIQKHNAFTMIEIIIAITILAILVTMAALGMRKMNQLGVDGQIKHDIASIEQAEQIAKLREGDILRGNQRVEPIQYLTNKRGQLVNPSGMTLYEISQTLISKDYIKKITNPLTSYVIDDQAQCYYVGRFGAALSDENTDLPIVFTDSAFTFITQSSATVSGEVYSQGVSAVTERGFIYSTKTNSTLADADGHITSGSGIGEFTETISGLTLGTLYYIRAYATNSSGTSYGTDESFATLSNLPTVETVSATAQSSSSAEASGNIIDDGGAIILERGVVYSTNANPEITDIKIPDYNSASAFTISITELSQATTYHVRAYAINGAGIDYGDDISFTTSSSGAVEPTVTTNDPVSNIQATTATSGGNVTSNGSASVTERGIVYSTSTSPNTTTGTKVTDASGGTGSFTSNLSGLSPGTTYHIRAYAKNSVGTAYGSDVSFVTLAQAPTVTTGSVSSITLNSAVASGEVISDNGSAVTERGIVYATSSNPTTANSKVTSGIGTGAFSTNLTGLTANTTYHVRAYAINAEGTSYGSDVPFTTVVAGGFISVASNNAANHSIGLRADGTVWTWGYNNYGQLGDGTITNESKPIQVNGLNNIVAIAAGASHSLALKNDGTVWGWGKNGDGELGDNSTTDRFTPVQVSGLSNVTAIAAGGYHSLAVKNDGTAWAWGYNGNGQLGNGTTTQRTSPVQVTGLSNVTAVSGGPDFSIALKNDGMVYAWGYNGYGQLGDGTTTQRTTPVQVTGLGNATAIAAGNWHSIALNSNGTVCAWGRNSWGQLGNNSTTDSYAPVQVSGLSNATAIAAGYIHSIAVKSDGTAWAWGYNTSGQLGDGTATQRNTPVQVSGLTNAIAAAGGYTHSLALKNDGTVWSWGTNNYGQLGDGTTTNQLTPVQVSLSAEIITRLASSITATSAIVEGTIADDGGNNITERGIVYSTSSNPTTSSSKAIAGTGRGPYAAILTGLTPGTTYYAKAYGINSSGTMYGNEITFTTVSGNGFVKIASNNVASHSIGLRADGTVWTWGYNNYGQLGDGTITNESKPIQVNGLNNIVAIAAGASHSLALKNDGTVWSWGRNGDGQLGDGTTIEKHTPVQVSGISNVTAIAAGGYHSLAVKNDGTAWTWGTNGNGQLGDGTATLRTSPVQVSGLSNVTAVSGGYDFSIALKNDGMVYAWGYNGYGELGDGTTTQRNTPVQVSGLGNTTAIAAGYVHSLALKNDGTVWAWGRNTYGQLGNSYTTDSNVPVQVSGLTNAVAIAAGYVHSIAVKSDGTAWAWGYNTSGQLGDGTATQRNTPVQVSGLTNAIAVAGGYTHSLALKNDGTIWSWGYNDVGQLGDGTTTQRLTPVRVITSATVTTGSVSNITSSAATATGQMVDDSGSTVTDYGIVYSTSSNPTTSDTKISSGSSPAPLTAITASLTGLTPNTTYHVRAYAINAAGTAYGSDVEFTTTVIDSYTKLLMHMDGINGSTTFTDTTGKTVTRNGTPVVSTSQSKFGGASASFNGSTDYLTLADSEDWNFGSGDFTIDLWFKRNSNGTRQFLVGQCDNNGTSGTASFHLYFQTDNTVYTFLNGGSECISPAAITDTTNWHHVAFIRDGNTLKLFIDGNLSDSVNATGVVAYNSPYLLAIGQPGEYGVSRFNGYIDELRISKGVARWTSNFTPPTYPY